MRRSLFWLLDHYPETGESLASVHDTALEHAQLADELGFDALWIAEHHFQKLGTVPNPAVVLAAIAERTTTLRLGPAVSVLPLRDATHVAEDYALVDMISGGRLNMGVGTGSQQVEFDGFGVDFEDRRSQFDARLAALREHWSSRTLNVEPVQQPAPPIFVATLQEEGAYAIGQRGDSMLTLVSPLTTDVGEIARRVEAHARGLRDAGHDADAAQAVVVAFTVIAESNEQARTAGASALGRFVQAMAGIALPDAGELYDQMRDRDTALLGTADDVARQLERYADAGITHTAFISRFGGLPAAASEHTLRQLADL